MTNQDKDQIKEIKRMYEHQDTKKDKKNTKNLIGLLIDITSRITSTPC